METLFIILCILGGVCFVNTIIALRCKEKGDAFVSFLLFVFFAGLGCFEPLSRFIGDLL